MNRIISILLITSSLIIFSCNSPKDPVTAWQVIVKEFAAGNFEKTRQMAYSLKEVFAGDSVLIFRLDSLSEMTQRIELDFSLSETEVIQQLQKVLGESTLEDKLVWENQNLLEYRIINGEKRYFIRAATNLKLLLAHQQKKGMPLTAFPPDETALFRMKEARDAVDLSDNSFAPVNPATIRIKYTITVNPDAVPAGEVIRCWMPYPKESHARQQKISLVSTYPEKYFIAPDSVGQRSLYLEQVAVSRRPAIFKIELTYSPAAQYFDLKKADIKPYDTGSAFYKRYTAEEYPHIVFSDKIRKLSDSIVGKETNPVEVVRKIFYRIDENIPWAGALEYSTMANIPEYVIDNRHGDCGMVTLLFMTLARYNGIPVKWQSGWMMHPGEVNLHDWCEVWYDGIGWVPLDMSFGRLPSEDMQIRDYYMSGIDRWRLIVNDATGGSFVPARKFLRSETVDFQRGELEWRGGNLYFDKWDYEMEVEYL